jgi:hypothetical protein
MAIKNKLALLEIPDNIYEDISKFVCNRFLNILEANADKFKEKISKDNYVELSNYIFGIRLHQNINRSANKSSFKDFDYDKSDFENYQYKSLIKSDFRIIVDVQLVDDKLDGELISDGSNYLIKIYISKALIKSIVLSKKLHLINDSLLKLDTIISGNIIRIIQELSSYKNVEKDFYPKLKESIIRFYDLVYEIEDEFKDEFIKHFIGYYGVTDMIDDNFKEALSKDKDTYQEMVNKFLKEINKEI